MLEFSVSTLLQQKLKTQKVSKQAFLNAWLTFECNFHQCPEAMKAIDVRQQIYRVCTDGEKEVNRFQIWKNEILKFVKRTIFIQILGCGRIYNHSLALYESSYRVITTVSSAVSFTYPILIIFTVEVSSFFNQHLHCVHMATVSCPV